MSMLLDELLAVPDHLDPKVLPPRFAEARRSLRDAIAQLQADGIPGRTLGAVLFSEAMPRLIEELGPRQVRAILLGMARQIDPDPESMQ